MSVVFYVSGHGFGHASRVIEIINELGRRAPGVPIHVRTSANPWLFERTLLVPATLHRVEVDTGMVQLDSLRLDVGESLLRAQRFYDQFEARVVDEARALADVAARLVVADLPPLAFAAAARVGTTAAAVGNFTWDWIYEAYPEHRVLAPNVPALIRAAHGLAEVAWRLPMHGGFEGFRRVEDVPLVARHARQPPEDVRARLGLPAGRTLVLVSFGGYGLDWRGARRLTSRRHHFVMTAGTDVAIADCRSQLGDQSTVVDERVMLALGVRYEDLVRAVDVVASKPGYGIIAECVANDRPLLYTDRGEFIEYHALVAHLPRWLRARYMTNEEVFSGQWDEAIDGVLARPAPPERPSTKGAAEVATRILDLLSRT